MVECVGLGLGEDLRPNAALVLGLDEIFSGLPCYVASSPPQSAGRRDTNPPLSAKRLEWRRAHVVAAVTARPRDTKELDFSRILLLCWRRSE